MTQRIPSLSAILLMTATPAFADAPNVVTDFGPTQGIVARVMEGVGTPSALLSASDTPHSFAMRPSHAQKLSDADIVFWAGADLTPWLVDPIQTVASGATTLELLEIGGWDVLEARSKHDHGHGGGAHEEGHDDAHDHNEEGHEDHSSEHDHDHDHDHAEDAHKDEHDHDHAEEAHAEEGHDDHDDHGFGHDPHAWLNPDIAAIWAMAISDQLSAADPTNASVYQANANQFWADIAALGPQIEALMAETDGRTILFPHDSTQYFEARFDLIPGGFIAESDAADPGPAHLQELRARITAGEITCVLSDFETNPGTVGILTEGTDVATAQIDITDSAGAGYIAMIQSIAETIAECAS